MLFNIPGLYDHVFTCARLSNSTQKETAVSQTARTYSKMSSFAADCFKGLNPLFLNSNA